MTGPGELDLHLIGEGRHEQLWQVLGSHVRRYDSAHGQVSGVSFAVWAPNARGIRVIGDFNGWDGRSHPMRTLGSSGVWELFVPDIGAGAHYKFSILGVDSNGDHGFEGERRPANLEDVFVLLTGEEIG